MLFVHVESGSNSEKPSKANALRCSPDSVSERTNTSMVILSATCEKLVPGPDSKTCLIARVWRVIKGEHLLDEIDDKTRVSNSRKMTEDGLK